MVTLTQFAMMDLKSQWETVSLLQEALAARHEAYLVLETAHATETKRGMRLESALMKLYVNWDSISSAAADEIIHAHGFIFEGGGLVDELSTGNAIST